MRQYRFTSRSPSQVVLAVELPALQARVRQLVVTAVCCHTEPPTAHSSAPLKLQFSVLGARILWPRSPNTYFTVWCVIHDISGPTLRVIQSITKTIVQGKVDLRIGGYGRLYKAHSIYRYGMLANKSLVFCLSETGLGVGGGGGSQLSSKYRNSDFFGEPTAKMQNWCHGT